MPVAACQLHGHVIVEFQGLHDGLDVMITVGTAVTNVEHQIDFGIRLFFYLFHLIFLASK